MEMTMTRNDMLRRFNKAIEKKRAGAVEVVLPYLLEKDKEELRGVPCGEDVVLGAEAAKAMEENPERAEAIISALRVSINQIKEGKWHVWKTESDNLRKEISSKHDTPTVSIG